MIELPVIRLKPIGVLECFTRRCSITRKGGSVPRVNNLTKLRRVTITLIEVFTVLSHREFHRWLKDENQRGWALFSYFGNWDALSGIGDGQMRVRPSNRSFRNQGEELELTRKNEYDVPKKS